MRCLLSLHVLATVVAASKTSFEMETSFNDLDLFQEFTLGSQSTYGRPDKCAQVCVRNPQCSMFSFNQEVETCQLYGNIVYPNVAFAQPLPGARYFAVRTDWCPLKSGFYMFRDLGICINLQTEMLNYDNARLKCGQLGARLVVLEEEDNAMAVMNLLTNMGLDGSTLFVGAGDQAKGGEYVWEDGRKMIRKWWHSGEPNNSKDEDCVTVVRGKLNDVQCNNNFMFICEKPE